ncbi:MAG: arylamine N-acetyltransferase [Acidobacteriota bacterium]|jgi:arylamine N-acetyltransferase|nr:arylamine N-acetyltransferase [Acidobacteriota bacterium]
MDMLAEFLKHFHIDALQPPQQLFCAAARAFSRIPYENITKIIRRAEAGSDEKARRGPDEVIADHIRWGAGGTCFSLTSALCQMARRMGFEAEYLLADRSYGQNTHSALFVRIDGKPYLFDPGFLITEPVPLALADPLEIVSGGERLKLIPGKTGISLFTERGGKSVYRLTYKTTPVDAGEFRKAWDDSFHWEMMRYPLLARAGASGRIYLRGSMFQVSGKDSVNRVKIPENELAAKISGEFGIHPAVVARALILLKEGT